MAASVLVACGDADRWCANSSTPGETIRTSPDGCTKPKSPKPEFSSVTASDICVECTPRCGATKYPFNGDNYYTDTDLPAGICTRDGERCDMEATAPLATCNGIVQGCALNNYRCHCTHGRWQCVMISQGAGACACDEAASTDAGPR